jgi:hypothetical protein
MGTNLQGYHLLWPDLPTFSQLQFTFESFTNESQVKGLLGFSIIQSTTNRMKPGWRKRSEHFAEGEASCLFFFKP